MERVGTTPGFHLYLTAGAAIEIGGLVGNADLEFLDAVDRSRNYRGGCSAHSACDGAAEPLACERRDVGVIVAGHIIGDRAAIELKRVLVRDRTCGISANRDAGLKDGKGSCVTAGVRQVHDLSVLNCGADR